MNSATASSPRPRAQFLDIVRGLAIIAMAIFHLGWDLYYFGYSDIDVTTDPGWVIFQKAILSSFLLLVGAGLWLGHGRAIRWNRFWRRWIMIVLAALLVTAGTLWMLPEYFVFFGVLHAIALFSLLALALLRLPTWAQAAIGVAVIGAAFAYTNTAFTDRWLAWIGFWPESPPTSDVVPIFPWFGVVVLGIAGMRLIAASAWGQRLLGFHSPLPLARGLAWMGRWSLIIYLVHQPVIIGVLWGLMQLQGQPVMPAPEPALTPQVTGFTQSCNANCQAAGSTAANCQAYCACALEQIEAADLWASLDASRPGPEQQAAINSIKMLCGAMSK